ncbi:hypothetical protein PTKIN_Ptkin04bG0113100 [Pterospermum kingtungense]
MPSKVKVFSWRIQNGFLSVSAELFRRHFNVEPKCSRCGKEPETIAHALRGNNKLHGRGRRAAPMSVNFAAMFLEEFNNAQRLHSVLVQRKKAYWRPPIGGCVKVNFNESFRNNVNQGGFGVTLIEQNQQQARQILIQNSLLTKALFQAQIMLGMVKPPQVVSFFYLCLIAFEVLHQRRYMCFEFPFVFWPLVLQQSQQSAQLPLQPNIQPRQLLPSQVGLQDQAAVSQIQPLVRKQHQNRSGTQISAIVAPPVMNLQSQTIPPYSLQMPQQTKGHSNPSMSRPQLPQLPNVPSLPLHSSAQPPHHQTHKPIAFSQLQQPLQTTGIPNMPLQPPMPPQARPPSVPTFHHQYAPRMGPNMGVDVPKRRNIRKGNIT